MDWIGKSGAITIAKPETCREISLTVHSGPAELYPYFPFLVSFSVAGQIEAYLEFEGGWDWQSIRLPVPAGTTTATIEVRSELARKPCDCNLGADERLLSICINSVQPEPGSALAARSALPAVRSLPSWWSDEDQMAAPIFVIGCYRSGTSILTWALGQHPDIFPMEETNWLPILYLAAATAYEIAAAKQHDSGPALYDLEAEDLLLWQGAALNRLHLAISRAHAKRINLGRLSGKDDRFDPSFRVDRSLAARKRRWVDGTPENTPVAIGLAGMFPQARMVYLIRDPAAVIRSLMQFHRIGGAVYSFEAAVRSWETLNLASYQAACELGQSRVLIVAYEQLAQAPQSSLQAILAFLDAPAFPQAARSFETRINSSGVRDGHVPDWDEAAIARLETIHHGILAGRPINSLPWSMPVPPFGEKLNDLKHRMAAVLGQPLPIPCNA